MRISHALCPECSNEVGDQPAIFAMGRLWYFIFYDNLFFLFEFNKISGIVITSVAPTKSVAANWTPTTR
jgi:hypothetical protein